MEVQTFSASGKLLLFGEYLVLRRAQSIVMPLKYQQSLKVLQNTTENIFWNCFDQDSCWLKIEFSPDLKIIDASDEQKALIVQSLLMLVQKEKTELRISGNDFRFEINFQRDYGFGTSSTFISLLSQWSGVNPYLLLEKSFGGSGFDIAAATQKSLFVYQAESQSSEALRTTRPVTIPESITKKLLFVYSGRKQKTRNEVLSFKDIPASRKQISEMNSIAEAVTKSSSIESFETLMQRSEALLSTILKIEPVKKKLFSDYPFAIKSLGAWGGDFIMATFRDEAIARNYFNEKGMQPIFNYQQLIRK